MEISVRLLCVDIPPDRSRGSVSLPEGSAIEQALERYAGKYALEIPLEEFKQSMFLINNRPSALDGRLSDGDVLTVMRTLAGG